MEQAKIKHLKNKFSVARYELIIGCEAKELQFYLYLKLYAINNHSAFPKQETIEEDLGKGWSAERLRLLVKKMTEKNRLIYIPGSGRRSSLYDITWYDKLNEKGISSKIRPLEKRSSVKQGVRPLKTKGGTINNITSKIYIDNKQLITSLFEEEKMPKIIEDVFDWKWCLKKADINPHLFFIALYWKQKEFKFSNREEAGAEIVRLTRKASNYVKKYSLIKFQNMLAWIEVDSEEKGEYEWTFETIDRRLSNYNQDVENDNWKIKTNLCLI